MTQITQTVGDGYVRYCAMPGFNEAWTYEDGRRPVYAIQCTPARPRDIPSDALAALWIAMHETAGFVPYETDRAGS